MYIIHVNCRSYSLIIYCFVLFYAFVENESVDNINYYQKTLLPLILACVEPPLWLPNKKNIKIVFNILLY